MMLDETLRPHQDGQPVARPAADHQLIDCEPAGGGDQTTRGQKAAAQTLSNFNDNNCDKTTTTTTTTTAQKPLGMAYILGEFGLYQLSLTLITFIRYVCCALMTNSGPLVAPALNFTCQLPPGLDPQQILRNSTSNTTTSHGGQPSDVTDLLLNKCHLDLVNGTRLACARWTYDTARTGATLTDTFQLVCDRDWLKSAFQSTTSVGIVVASILWGSFSDRYGRYYTMRVCFFVSLVAGLVSYQAPTFAVYALARSICSLSDVGLVVSLATIVVETLGTKYRGATCIVVYTGWAMGVMIMPWCTDYFRDFRALMLFTVACHLATLPWLLSLGESIRWLLVNGRIEEAGREVERIGYWNCWDAGESLVAGRRFDAYKAKFELMAKRRREAGGGGDDDDDAAGDGSGVFGCLASGLAQTGKLFQTRELALTTVTMVWATFNSELLYMLFILINSDIGDDVKLNYAIGGVVEILATLSSMVVVAYVSRRFSLAANMLLIAGFCVCLAFTHQFKELSLWTLNFAKFSISNLTSIVYVVTTEVFPTNLRQTGIGLAATLGSMGAVLAPFIRTELTELIGMTNVMLMLCLLPISAAIAVPIFLRETKGIDLADDIDDIDINDDEGAASCLTPKDSNNPKDTHQRSSTNGANGTNKIDC